MPYIWKSLGWLLVCFILIVVSITYLYQLYDFDKLPSSANEISQVPPSNSDLESMPQVMGVESNLELEDGRVEIVANFLERKGSPLEPYDHYGKILVDIADKYSLDFRFLPAIMMKESQLCKRIPEGSYNCLGFGIHSRGTLGFESYEAGFERAAKELRANYVNQGRLQVSQIARKYTASVEDWTSAVNQFMAEMEYDDRKLGIEKKTDASVLEYVKTDDEL